jgi:DNA-binding PadR family transcriptional regulator
MTVITKFEEILLLVIWRLDENAYGVKMRQFISEELKRDVTYGNLYSVLDQLTKKGFVHKRLGEPTPNRRGRRKIYYRVTPEGKRALQNTRELNDILWKDVPEFAFSGR